MSEEDARWGQLVHASFLLEESERPQPLVALDSVLEVFDAELDPVEDFRAYAVRRFASSLRRAITSAQQ